MFSKYQMLQYLKYAAIAAILFCLPAIFFIRSGDYGKTYFLYIGNGLFLIGVLLFLLQFNKQRAQNASTSTMLIAGHVVTAMGIVIAAILALLLVFLFAPDVFSANVSETVLKNANPSDPGAGRPHGFLFFLFMSTLVGNVCTGSAVSILIPYTIKRDQTKDKASEFFNIRKAEKQ